MMLLEPVITTKPHPARYTESLLPVMARMAENYSPLLDPMAGTGRIFKLARFGYTGEIHAIEMMPQWAAHHPKTKIGNALHLDYPDNSFGAVCVSPAYGNRMADKHLPDGTRRNTYANYYGDNLPEDNGAALQWGDAYRELHRAAWAEARRVLANGGVFVLNIKDHIRNGKRMRVTLWHIFCLQSLGFELVEYVRVDCPGQRNGQNHDLRMEYESVIKFRLGVAA